MEHPEGEWAIGKLHEKINEARVAAEMFALAAREVTPDTIQATLREFAKVDMPDDLLETILEGTLGVIARIETMSIVGTLAMTNFAPDDDRRKQLADKIEKLAKDVGWDKDDDVKPILRFPYEI